MIEATGRRRAEAPSHPRTRFVVLAFALPLPGACAHYQPQPLSASATAAVLEARGFDDPRLQTFVRASLPGRDVGPVRWDLASLTLAALYFHPDLDIARSRLAAARAAIATARQRPNPTLNFSPLYNLDIAQPTPWTVGGVISFVVETFGKRAKRTEQARALAEAARWDLATAGWRVRGRVRGAVLDLWAAQRRLDIARQRAELANELVGLLEQRLAAGQASALEVTRARIDRTELELAIRQIERALAEARARLAAAVGVPVRALDGITVSLNDFDAAPAAVDNEFSELRRRALVARTDIEASLAEYAAADWALKLQLANQYPNLSIGPEYNWGAIQETRISNQVGTPLSLELPVFNRNEGPIAEAAARRRQAAVSLAALQAQVIGEIDEAAATYAAASRSLATASALGADAARRERQVANAFRAGAVDRPTLVGAEVERAAAEAARFDAIVAQRQAIGAIEDATQQPLFAPALRPVVSEANPRIGAGSPP